MRISLKKCIKLIEQNNLIWMYNVADFYPCSRPTLYANFPPKSDGWQKMRDALDKNRGRLKLAIFKKMFEIDNPTTLIALYKLLGTPEERKRLSSAYVEVNETGNRPLDFKDIADILNDHKKTDDV